MNTNLHEIEILVDKEEEEQHKQQQVGQNWQFVEVEQIEQEEGQ